MTEDYLWDGSGEPEPEVAYLEEVLGKLRWSGRQPKSERVTPLNWWNEKRPWAIAAAAALVLALGTALLMNKTPTPHSVTSWNLSFPGQGPSSVRAGQIIETGLSHAIMESEFIGEVDIDPNSRLRLLASRQGQHRLALDHGTIRALIWAPRQNLPSIRLRQRPSIWDASTACLLHKTAKDF